MAIRIEMPKLSDTMTEGRIIAWKKKEGEAVSAGEILAEIESDKSAMEMEAYDSGYLRKILVPEGGTAPVGAPIAVIAEDPNEEVPEALLAAAAAAPTPAAPAEAPVEPAAGTETRPAPARAEAAAQLPREARKILATPLAFRIAAEKGIDIARVRGTGPGGRIVKRDVESVAASAGVPPRPSPAPTGAPAPAEGPFAARPQAATSGSEDVPVSMMRKLIAKRLSESKNSAPHFYASVEVDMAPAWAARESLKRLSGADISFNDIVVKATAVALTRHPAANASWQGDSIRYHRSVDIGVAVSVPDGLIVPVVRACHAKGLLQISEEIRALAERARERKLEPEEYQGSTFTVSNLGMLGVTHFTGILNPPEACLLAVGAIRAVPVVEGDRIVPGKRMTLTLSCDHRVIDGAQAARFLDDLRKILENPLALAL